MSEFRIETDNTQAILNVLTKTADKILHTIGQRAETNTKKIIKRKHIIGTPESTGKKGYRGGTLLGSITHVVNSSKQSVSIGTNVEYAPYVELGTGPYFTPPPEWEQFGSERGSGIGHGYVKPRPYLRPAIEEHMDEYKQIIEQELRNA